ncbi:MAG: CoA transferase [Chloroflexi bacterium]|nr:CoA transferase [Chloroflexota bacterium]
MGAHLRRLKPAATGRLALEGLKVADFSWYIAGPWMVRYLADHGATAVRVESSRRPDGTRVTPPFKDNTSGLNRSVVFANVNCNKYSITLDLGHPRARPVVTKIIEWADVVIESFTPGTMERLKLTYGDVKAIKPDIIMLSASVQGQDGPHAKHSGFGWHLLALAGFIEVTGWSDRPPTQPASAYTDLVTPPFAVAALMAALLYRKRTGKGQYIDLSHYEASTHFLSPLLLDCSVNKRLPERTGNRSPCAAPHGAYPCLGNDKWCAIGVFDDRQWEGFCKAAGNPEWARDPRFATFPGRKRNEDELDGLVAGSTAAFVAADLVGRLQALGVPAGIVKDAEEIQNDPQLQHRGHFWPFAHAEIGEHTVDRLPFQLSKTPAQPLRPAPLLGQDNELFYTRILGMPDDEFVELLREGVLD